MTLNIPDFMPVLRHGVGEKPKDGGCLMQCASFIAYGAWEDRPDCVHDYLNELGIKVNDSVGDAARSGLALVIPDLLNTDDAYQAWESDKEHGDIRKFWMDEAGYAALRFRGHAVKACSSCFAAVGRADDPATAARNYVRCLIENAAGLLWNDETWDEETLAAQGLKPVPVETQRILVDLFADLVRYFNEHVANTQVQVTDAQWRELREAMTPAEVAPA